MNDHDYKRETYEEEIDTIRREKIRAMGLQGMLELISNQQMEEEPFLMKYINGSLYVVPPKDKIDIIEQCSKEVDRFVPGLLKILEEIIVDNNLDKK